MIDRIKQLYGNLDGAEKFALGLCVLLILCPLKMPYGYYTIVRLLVAFSAAIWGLAEYTSKKYTNAAVCGFVVVLFQPLIKITMEKATWNVIDIILAILILILVFSRRIKNYK